MYGLLSSNGFLAASRATSSSTPRPAPPHPTPITFPAPPPSTPTSWHTSSPPDFAAAYASLKRHAELSTAHWAQLNITTRTCATLDDFVSAEPALAPFVPPLEWLSPPGPTDSASPPPPPQPAKLSNGRFAPFRRDFYARASELAHANDAAYTALAPSAMHDPNLPRPPRIAHMRKFWEALDGMACYWDASADMYYPKESPPPYDPPKPSNADTTRAEESDLTPRTMFASAARPAPAPAFSPAELLFSAHQAALKPTPSPPPRPTASPLAPPAPAPSGPGGFYTGHRLSAGSSMPPAQRVEAVTAFLEAAAWAHGLRVAPHRRQPVLSLCNLRVPVYVSSAVWRLPTERERAKAGWLEGPVAGVLCRAETGFGDAAGPGSKDLVDAFREVAALLELAQERARAGPGDAEPVPGRGKWWVEKARWGGGPGGEVGEVRGDVDPQLPKGEAADAAGRSKEAARKKERSGKRAADVWRALKPGAGWWDARVLYSAIGRAGGEASSNPGPDTVFLVSSLNHHVCVLALRVHPLYLAYLTHGTLPDPRPVDDSWCRPVLTRSPWWDLFQAEERLEALRAIWGVVGYLSRVTGGEDGAMEGT
ncbi:hypothetical protein EJ06DRAFT_580809 [Trichodelitschia bisporula]|uniref:Uncharacterized protein n=1 Tax=Trichodelitschia bisporula TaxID=703511 RepID=A0A6G1I2S9_9PEZI|nr:hypothetical protein EJ06DRAFT_580809 [Trichodelitschia bisporula]